MVDDKGLAQPKSKIRQNGLALLYIHQGWAINFQ